MRINTNISALRAGSNLASVENDVSKSMAKLSSGFRITRASDDAAGLGIANKLRADIRSLGAAGRNAEQANSVLNIAEGAAGTIQNAELTVTLDGRVQSRLLTPASSGGEAAK